MGNTYTRQSSYSDGDVITAAHTNDEFNQLLAAFQASSGHTHDGTANEGGPITKMLGTSLTLGDGTAGTDITVTFDVESINPEFVVVKATAKKGDVSVESYGEASPQNTQQKYPVAMAEKRALSRVILKITGFYKYGVFGEDESDDFKQEA